MDSPDAVKGESADWVGTVMCSEKLSLSSRVTPRFSAEWKGDTGAGDSD